MDDWVRGAYAYSLALSSPWGRIKAAHAAKVSPRHAVYRGHSVDVPAALNEALDQARGGLEQVARVVAHGRFTPRSKSLFLESVPDAPVTPCAA